jgi:hypothetical protein
MRRRAVACPCASRRANRHPKVPQPVRIASVASGVNQVGDADHVELGVGPLAAWPRGSTMSTRRNRLCVVEPSRGRDPVLQVEPLITSFGAIA